MVRKYENNNPVVEEGNNYSSTTKRKQDLQYLFWVFTFFYNDKIEIEILENRLKSYCKSYFYGFENCPTTGKNHLQGFFTCMKKRRFTEITKQFPHMRVEQCKGSKEANEEYCGKDGNIVKWSRDDIVKGKIKRDFNLSLEEMNEIEKILSYPYGIYKTYENSVNFKKELYANHNAKYLEIYGLKSLDKLRIYKDQIYVLNFSDRLSDDDITGILSVLESGLWKGKVFDDAKYIMIHE